VVVETYLHDGAMTDSRAHHVQGTRNPEMQLPEAVHPRPREVRVAKHHAAAVRSDVRPERPAVRAEQGLPDVEALERGGRFGSRRWRIRGFVRGGRACPDYRSGKQR